MKAVVLGGTNGQGRAVARLVAERGDAVFGLGRDAEEVEYSAADLAARHPQKKNAGSAKLDLERTDDFIKALDEADAALGGFDTVIVTAAMFATQDQLEADPELVRRLTTVNYAHTVVFCEHARQRLLARGGGTLAVFTSVAGDRGRKPIVIYGSTKAAVSAYLEGLDLKFHAQGLHVLNVKPGFVKTGMTAGLKPPPFAGEPEQVARDVVKALDRMAEVIIPAEVHRAAEMVLAKGAAAPTIEHGAAVAEVLQLTSEAWKTMGDKAKEIYVIQHLEEILGAVIDNVDKIKVREVNVLDRGDGSGIASYAASFPHTVAAVLTALRETTGVDVPAILAGGRAQ